MAITVRSELIHGVTWNFLEKFLSKIAGFIIGIVLARILSPSDFGLIGMLAIFISLSNTFIEGGLAKALIQCQNNKDIDFSTAFVTNVGMSIVIYIVLFLSAPWIAYFYEEPILTMLTRVLAINFILGSFNIVQRAKLMIAVDFKSLAKINIVSVILSGIVSIGMAYAGFGVWALVGQAIFSTIILMFLFPFYSQWKPSLKFSFDSFKHMFRFGSNLLITGVVSIIVNNISTICIGRYYRSHQLGYYTRATQFSDLISHTLYDVLGNVTFPVLSKLQNDESHMVSIYRKSLYITAFFIFPTMVLLAILSRPLVIILLTEKWLPSVVLMQWLFLARIFYPLSAINMNLLNAIGRSDLFMKLDLSKIPLDIVVLIITIPLGVKAIVIGSFCLSFICFFINAYLPGRIFGYGAISQLSDWKGILLSVGIMSIVVLGVLHLITNVWFQVVIGGITGVFVYVVCCFFFKVFNRDVISVLKRKG